MGKNILQTTNKRVRPLWLCPLIKKIFTLFIWLLLLPVTALAVEGAPNSLYVGDQQVINGNNTTFWTTDKSTGGLTEYEGNDDNWNVKYDPSTVTLTLKNATIKGVYNNVNTSGSGIYAASSSGPVSLNIVLEEENKVSGMHGINVSSSGGDASLNISGSGSLTVSGLSGNGIGIFMSSQNSANLTIEEASVTALGSQDGGSGVRLITSQTGSPSLTIEVKGGSLQASGETNGIHFLSNVNDATAVANMKVSGNAMVKASNIITTKDGTGSAPELKPAASGSDGTGGIIWDGKSGTVYGNVTLQEDITIGEGESLTIGQDANLTVPFGTTLTNNGTVTTEGGGTLTNNGKIYNSGTLPDNIQGSAPPKITTASLLNGTVGTSYSQTLASDNNPTNWSITSGTLPAGLTLDTSTGEITGAPTTAGTSTFTVTATNSAGSDSKELSLTVKSVSVTGVKLDQESLTLQENGSATLTATVEPANASNQDITWKSSDTSIATVDANGTVTAISAGTATITATAQDGSGVSASCSVTVTHSMVHTPKKDATCTEDGNIEYWYCKNCDKYFSDENATEELSDVVIPATGHHYVNGYCTKCGHRDPDYRPDPISYYNIYIEDVCDGVEVTLSNNVVREGNSISVYVKKDTANYTFDNFKVYYKRSYYGGWEELKEGTQPGEYPIKNIWTHIYIKAEGAEEKEDPTGIESIEGVKVYTKDGSLYVQTPQREQVIIVSMSGAVVKNEEQIGLKQYHGLHPGIYIVRVGDKAYKLCLN
ncbi:Ig-like domain-containing protein [Parabacteroides sp. AGMB00274]|uniref:Ig-like domain-containing protein n=1 Tax=Parabacteroides faecalis TaxID=2924040 RepID=A0ABT0C270_9BACT|nr:Ig-like domain-containing protein [Parabacteroides faecalis]MCJ2381117.1 Ig-like domain-containing protein [Parabacteroides faecalis]